MAGFPKKDDWVFEFIDDYNIVSGLTYMALIATKVGSFKVHATLGGDSRRNEDVAKLLRLLADEIEKVTV